MKFDKFFQYFSDFNDSYVIIGGNAAAFWIERDQQSFRATQDYDMVVIFENQSADFSKRFIQFIEENKYEISEYGTDETKKKAYYRFRLPRINEINDVPKQIELFSRKPLDYILKEPTATTPLHYDDGPSLSAIILDDDYYQLLKECQSKVGNVSVLSVPGLIFFKAKAHLDIQERLQNGEKISHSANKSKHFNDVCRLCGLLTPDENFDPKLVPQSCRNDLRQFIKLVENFTSRDFRKRLKNVSKEFDLSRDDVLEALNSLL